MSLDFNFKKIENYEDTCYIQEAEGRRIRGLTETLIWSTITIGMNSITKKNAKEFFTRISFYEKCYGCFLYTDKSDRPITLQDIEAHIGLETNASNRTKSQFIKTVYDRHENDTKRELRRKAEEAKVA